MECEVRKGWLEMNETELVPKTKKKCVFCVF